MGETDLSALEYDNSTREKYIQADESCPEGAIGGPDQYMLLCGDPVLYLARTMLYIFWGGYRWPK